MENLFDFDGGFVDHRAFTSSADPKDELIRSLTSFIRLYSQNKDGLQTTSHSFTLTAARLHETYEGAFESKTARALFTVCGGVLGAACGGVSGGVCGTLGAIGATTFCRFCGKINAVGATVGIVSSILGGVAGGVFGGGVGSAVGAAAEASRRPVDGAVSDVAWFTIGCAAGGAIGGIYGGTVGAAGGAIGGAFGAVLATRFTVSLVGGVVGSFCGSKDSKEQKMKPKKENVMQRTRDFSTAITLLVEELKTIKSITDKMASGDSSVQSLAEQTARTLTSVTTMEKTLSDSQKASGLPQFVSSVEEAARQIKRTTEELETTRAEVEKLLVSLRKH